MSNNSIDQASSLRQLATAHPVQVIAVTAGKGGVGKTNITANLAIELAKHKRVMLLDADLGLANIDVLLGLPCKKNLSHVISGECDLQDIVVNGPNDVKIIPAASGRENLLNLSSIEHSGLIQAFSDLTDVVDIMLIDTAAGISSNVLTYAQAAQEVIVVVCDEPTSLTDAYALIKVMNKQHGCQRFRVIANMVRDAKEGRDLFTKLTQVTDQFLEVSLDYLGAIPFDECIRQAVKKQKAVINAFPTSRASRELKRIAEKISTWPVDCEEDGVLGFFIERIIRYKSANNQIAMGGG